MCVAAFMLLDTPQTNTQNVFYSVVHNTMMATDKTSNQSGEFAPTHTRASERTHAHSYTEQNVYKLR